MQFPSLQHPQILAFYWIASTQSDSQTIETQFWQEFRGQADGREIDITIAGPTSVMSSRIIPYCLNVTSEFPQLRIHFRIEDTSEIVSMLRKDEVQFGILSAHEVELELESKKIKAQEFVLVGHPSWESENLNEIIQSRRIIDFHSSDLTTIRYLKHCQLLPKTLPRRIYANQNELLIQMLQAGLGYGPLTREVAQESLKLKKLMSDPIYSSEMGEANPNNPKYINEVSHANAKQSARILWESSPEIQSLVKNKETILISGILDVKSGKVTFDEPFQP